MVQEVWGRLAEMGFTLPSGRIEDLDTADAHVTFIRMQWADFAAFAWSKYLSEGRGAVVVDLLKASKTAGVLQVPTYYVAEVSIRLSDRGGWPTEEIAEVVRDYDPEQDVVFLFNRLDGNVYHYNATDELTPPKAYQSKRGAKESRPSRLSFDEPPTSD